MTALYLLSELAQIHRLSIFLLSKCCHFSFGFLVGFSASFGMIQIRLIISAPLMRPSLQRIWTLHSIFQLLPVLLYTHSSSPLPKRTYAHPNTLNQGKTRSRSFNVSPYSSHTRCNNSTKGFVLGSVSKFKSYSFQLISTNTVLKS